MARCLFKVRHGLNLYVFGDRLSGVPLSFNSQVLVPHAAWNLRLTHFRCVVLLSSRARARKADDDERKARDLRRQEEFKRHVRHPSPFFYLPLSTSSHPPADATRYSALRSDLALLIS